HNFIDKPATGAIHWWKPRNLCMAEPLLQALQQRHEVPYRKDVMLHKNVKRIHTINASVDRVFQERFSQRSQPSVNIVKRFHRWRLFLAGCSGRSIPPNSTVSQRSIFASPQKGVRFWESGDV